MNTLCFVNLTAFCLLLMFSCAAIVANHRHAKLKQLALLLSLINITILRKFYC